MKKKLAIGKTDICTIGQSLAMDFFWNNPMEQFMCVKSFKTHVTANCIKLYVQHLPIYCIPQFSPDKLPGKKKHLKLFSGVT